MTCLANFQLLIFALACSLLSHSPVLLLLLLRGLASWLLCNIFFFIHLENCNNNNNTAARSKRIAKRNNFSLYVFSMLLFRNVVVVVVMSYNVYEASDIFSFLNKQKKKKREREFNSNHAERLE